MRPTDISRRDLLKAGGALVVSFAIPGAARGAFGQAGAGAKPLLLPDELDSWIAVTPHGSVTAFFGKMDMGQGVDVAIAQIVADELDVAFDRSRAIRAAPPARPACSAVASRSATPRPKPDVYCWSAPPRSSACPLTGSSCATASSPWPATHSAG